MEDYQLVKMKYVGIRPLILANPQQNLKDPAYVELKQIQSKRSKTEADRERIAYLQFVLSFYLNKEKQFIIPAKNIFYNLTEGAKKIKKGKDVKRAVFVETDPILQQNYGKTIDELFNSDVRFTHLSVGNMNAKMELTRPKFDDWSLDVEIFFDKTELSQNDIEQIAFYAGKLHGLGGWRPLHGLFRVEFIN